MMWARRALMVAAAAAWTLTPAGEGMAADLSPELAAIVKAADKEPPLKLVWSTETLDGISGAKIIRDGMNKMFGTHVEMKFAPGGSMPQVGNQIAAEYKAGRQATSDVYITSLNNAARFGKDGVFEAVPWTKILPGRITDEMVEDGGMSLRFVTNMTSVVYNTKLLPNPPRTLQGFLAPELKGKFATTPYAASFDIIGSNDMWGPTKTMEFAKAFSKQVSGLIRCADISRVASGEFQALVMACGGSSQVLTDQGAPIDWFVPQDAASLGFFYFMVPKNAASPNAAKLLITYLMTPEGQKIAWDTWRNDLHFFPDSHAAKRVEALHKLGVKVHLQTIEWSNAHPEGLEVLRDVTKLFRDASN